MMSGMASARDRDFDGELAARIGRAIRGARRARRLRQADVATRIGVSPQFYGRMERGKQLPSITTLRDLAVVLDVRPSVLLSIGAVEPTAEEEDPKIRKLRRQILIAQPEHRDFVDRVVRDLEMFQLGSMPASWDGDSDREDTPGDEQGTSTPDSENQQQ
jgi:transcriptional regulator with XRE-family HTH domain